PCRKPWGGLLPNPILQRLARVERREPRRGDLDSLARLGIAAFARLPLPSFERTESRDLDFLAGHERRRDQTLLAGREERVDDGPRLARGQGGLLRDDGDELGLVHSVSPPFG